METQLEKARNYRKVLRSKTVTSRMIGMYRLMNEELLGEGNALFRNDQVYTTAVGLPKKDWTEFKGYVFEELDRLVLSKMEKIVYNATHDTGSLGDLLYSENYFPKQSISIRVGSVMENALHRFLITKATDKKIELEAALELFADHHIQLDIANQYDGTIVIGEVKYNFNLDTRKTSVEVEKLDIINTFVKDRYKTTDLKTMVCFISARYPVADQVMYMKPELVSVKDLYVMGYQELFSMYGVRVTENMWRRLHRDMEREIMTAYEGV